MRRTIYIPIVLLLIAVSVVAMVRAQDWGGWPAGVQPQEPRPSTQPHWASASMQSSSTANQPQRIEPGAATPLPSRFAAPQPAEQPAAQPQPQSGFAQTPRLPPLMIENQYVTDEQVARPAPVVTPTQAVEPSPSDEPNDNQSTNNVAVVSALQQPVEFHPDTSRRVTSLPSQPTHSTNSNTGAAVQLPNRLVQATEKTAPTNQASTIDNGPSSRRPHSLRDPAPVQDAQPSQRVAQREERNETPPSLDENKSNVLFHAAAPALAVTMSGPAKIAVGKAADYTVSISNNSRVDAEDVVVHLDVPSWAEVTSSEASLGAARHESIVGDNSRLKWSIFRLEAGARETLTLKIAPQRSRSFELAVGWSYAPKSHTAQIEVQEPKLEMMLSGPRDVLYGETKTYTITVANPGTGPAENVVINLLPIAPGQDKAGVSNLGAIEAGGRREIEIDLTARQAGDLELRAQAFADAGLRAEAAQPIHVRRAALEAVVGGPEIKYAGTVAAYQVRVANTGDALAENVVAEAVLPRGANFVGATDGGQMQKEQGRVQWQIGPLRPGATRVFEMRCILAEAGVNRLEIIAGADGDLTSAAHWVTRVEALADLKLLVNDPQGPVPAGEPTVYEVRVINRGTKAAEGVQVASFFSQGIEPLSVEGGRAEIGIGQVVFSPISRIAAGQELVFHITAKADGGGNHTFRTEVVCTSPETKLAAQETTRFYDVSTGGAAGQIKNDRPAEANLAPPQFDQRR